jgi:hypothetical protein
LVREPSWLGHVSRLPRSVLIVSDCPNSNHTACKRGQSSFAVPPNVDFDARKRSNPLSYHHERVKVLGGPTVRGTGPVELGHHLATRAWARRGATFACLACALIVFASAGCSSTAPVRRTLPHVPVVNWQLGATAPAATTPGEAPVPSKDISGAAPNPNPSVNFLAASCASAGFCAVVGQYTDATGSLSGLIDLWWKGAWRS